MAGKSNDLEKLLDSTLLVKHPMKSITVIWDHAKSLNSPNPAEAFSAFLSLKLVGPFDLFLVADKENVVSDETLIQHRYATDLPEMQTIMVFEGGRFCFWRDSPTDSEPFLVHVSHKSEHFPKMEVVGNHSDLFAALHCVLRLMAPTKACEAQLTKLFPDATYTSAHYEALAREAKRRRSKITIGQPFHGLGIRVTVKNDVGYRPVTENLKRLKREIETMATTDNESLRQTIRERILEIHSNIQYANDEKDFGMALEFGHDVFVANYERFDGLAKSVLLQAYRLLGRDAFADILEAHYAAGRRNYSTN